MTHLSNTLNQQHVRTKKAILIYNILAFMMAMMYTSYSNAQSNLNISGDIISIPFTGEESTFTIPNASTLNGKNLISFKVKGADGGKRKVLDITKKGGGGAVVRTTFEIGTADGQLEPGGRIRFIVGRKGASHRSSNVAGAGGGGGSAVLYTTASNSNITCGSPSTNLDDAASCWVILAVAGGGGGAYATGLGDGASGKSGRADECGGDGNGPQGGNGGCNGNGGNKGGNSQTYSGGGGGALSSGTGGNIMEGKSGSFSGGDGGDGVVDDDISLYTSSGGYGYGGGGSGRNYQTFTLSACGGGGGGGYSGGGGGDNNAGGGGGSFVNSAAVLSEKEGGGKDGSPDNGKLTYQVEKGSVTGPVAKCKDLDVTLDNNGNATLQATDIDDGSLVEPGETISLFISYSTPIGVLASPYIDYSCDDIGENYGTLLVTSTSGKSARCSFLVEVIDNTPPSVNCTPFDLVAYATYNTPFELNIADIVVSTSDACGNIEALYASKEIFTCSDVGANTITVFAEDNSGNVGSCSYTVNVAQGSEANSLTCPADVTVEIDDLTTCSATLDGLSLLPDVTGSCANELTYEIRDGMDNVVGTGSGFIEQYPFPVGTNTLFYTLGANNLANPLSCSFTVTVDDLFPGTAAVVCPPDITISLAAQGGCATFIDGNQLEAIYSPCENTFSVESVFTPVGGISVNQGFTSTPYLVQNGRTFEIGTTILTYYSSVYGAVESCSTTITVNDDVAPTANCKNITVNLEENCSATVYPNQLNNGSTDDCGGLFLSMHYDVCDPLCFTILNQPSFTYSGQNSQPVTLVCTDESGNTATCSSVITFQDQTPPPALCKDVTVMLSNPVLSPSDLNNGSSDHCTAANDLEFSIAEDGNMIGYGVGLTLDCNDAGSITLDLKVKDEAGNEGACTSNITVVDDLAPTATCQDRSFTLQYIDDQNGFEILTLSDLDFLQQFNDNCTANAIGAGNVFTFSGCDDLGSHSITATFEDEAGNQVSCTANLTILENSLPVANCQNPVVVVDGNGIGTLTVDQVNHNSFDYCMPVSLSFNSTAAVLTMDFDCSDVGSSQPLTLYVKDNSGNTSSCMANVTVEDNVSPGAMCLNTTVSLSPEGTYSLQLADVYDAINSNDNCPNGILDASFPATLFNCNDVDGIFSIPVTVTDQAGNSSNCTANITVQEGYALPDGWSAYDVGNVTVGNHYEFASCGGELFYITGSGNNAISSTHDNVAFAATPLCGNGSVIAKIESVDPNGYGGLMIRETADAGAKQASIFSNLSNILRHEVRYNTNGVKTVSSFFKPFPYWLKLERQGDWVFSYYSTDGVNFQYVQGVYLPMQNCIEIGLASFTYQANQQTEAVFSHVSVSGGNGGFAENDGNTTTSLHHHTIIPSGRNTAMSFDFHIFPNPSHGPFTIQFEEAISEDAQLTIYNTMGQLIEQINIEAGMDRVEHDLSQYTAGIYLLRIDRGTQGSVVRKINIMNN